MLLAQDPQLTSTAATHVHSASATLQLHSYEDECPSYSRPTSSSPTSGPDGCGLAIASDMRMHALVFARIARGTFGCFLHVWSPRGAPAGRPGRCPGCVQWCLPVIVLAFKF